MTNTEKILWAFQQNGYKLTLGYALQHEWGYKLTSRISDLRKRGYQIDCILGKTPSDNTYVLKHFDETGQGTLL